MRSKNVMTIGAGILLLYFLAACQQAPEGEPTSETSQQVTGQAQVESVEVLILEGFPHEVQVYTRGTLEDACTAIDSVSMSRSGDQFTGIISTIRPWDAVCAQVLAAFERLIPLDVDGLPAGEYTITVNGTEATFVFEQDNIAPTATPVDGAVSGISGRVWHDLCGTAGGTPLEPEVVTDDCEELNSGGFIADGRRKSTEPSIAGVQVSLGVGACPQAAVVSSETTEDGRFSFSGLKAGTYCVFIDPLISENRELLIPGAWTAPAIDQGFAQVDLEIGDQIQGVDFGWDYENLPAVNFEGCQNQAQFVDDLTIPDDTIFAPGDIFTKTWQIRNTGTCHWDSQYSLDFAAGDQMDGGAAELSEVLSGEDVEVSVQMRAPETEGSYRGDWQLLNPDGERFGTVGDFDLTFFVKIVVEEPEITPAAIRGVVWDDRCAVLAGGSPSDGCDSDTDGNFIANGIFDEDELPLEGVEITVFRGTCPPRGTPLETVISGENGAYLVEGLNPGLYCVVIDPAGEGTKSIFETGRWTQPGIDVSSINIEVEVDEIRDDIDFAWDFEVD